jgi:hypothetical protein
MFVNTHVTWREIRRRNWRQFIRWGGALLAALIVFLLSFSVYSVTLFDRLLPPPTPTAAPGPLIEFSVLPPGDSAP